MVPGDNVILENGELRILDMDTAAIVIRNIILYDIALDDETPAVGDYPAPRYRHVVVPDYVIGYDRVAHYMYAAPPGGYIILDNIIADYTPPPWYPEAPLVIVNPSKIDPGSFQSPSLTTVSSESPSITVL